MYGSSSNNGSNNCAETSISGEDEEKRSQAYSSQTDYAMVRIDSIEVYGFKFVGGVCCLPGDLVAADCGQNVDRLPFK